MMLSGEILFAPKSYRTATWDPWWRAAGGLLGPENFYSHPKGSPALKDLWWLSELWRTSACHKHLQPATSPFPVLGGR